MLQLRLRTTVRHGACASRPAAACARTRFAPALRAAAGTTGGAPPQSTDELLAEVGKLASLAHDPATDQAALDAQAERVAQLSAAAGTNKVVAELNDGSFKGYTLSGRTAERFRKVIDLGTMSFKLYQPADLKVKMTSTDSSGVYKGADGSTSQAYVVTAGFNVVEWDGQEGSEAVPTGVSGVSKAISEYRLADDNQARMFITFKRLRLSPASDDPEHLARWLDLLLPHNPTMDPKTGVLEVDLPSKSPEGYLDALVMTEKYQLLQGNYGSRTLLERI